jgi:hypothetical protein
MQIMIVRSVPQQMPCSARKGIEQKLGNQNKIIYRPFNRQLKPRYSVKIILIALSAFGCGLVGSVHAPSSAPLYELLDDGFGQWGTCARLKR